MDYAKETHRQSLVEAIRAVRDVLTLADIGGVLSGVLEQEERTALAFHLTKEPMTKERLLPWNARRRLLTIGGTIGVDDPVCYVKFFYPDFSWTWYPLEWDGEDTFYGLVDGDVPELGMFSLSELLANRGKWGLEIERDRWFRPTPVSQLMKKGS